MTTATSMLGRAMVIAAHCSGCGCRHGRTAQYLNSGILPNGIERRVGQQVGRRLVVGEGHEHRAVRRAVVAPHVDRDLAAARRARVITSPGCRPSARRSRRFIEAVAIGSSASSTRGAARHAAGVPVLELAAGDQHEGVLGIGPLVGRDDVGRHQLHAAVGGREVAR